MLFPAISQLLLPQKAAIQFSFILKRVRTGRQPQQSQPALRINFVVPSPPCPQFGGVVCYSTSRKREYRQQEVKWNGCWGVGGPRKREISARAAAILLQPRTRRPITTILVNLLTTFTHLGFQHHFVTASLFIDFLIRASWLIIQFSVCDFLNFWAFKPFFERCMFLRKLLIWWNVLMLLFIDLFGKPVVWVLPCNMSFWSPRRAFSHKLLKA